MVDALRKFRRKLGAVNNGLGELPAAPRPLVPDEEKKKASKKRERVVQEPELVAVPSSIEDDDQDDEEEEAEENEVSREQRKRVLSVAGKRAISDGAPGRSLIDGTFVYFSLNDEMCPREEKLFLCSSPSGIMAKVARSKLEQVSYDSLEGEEKSWYLERLLEDVISRFKLNFPVLFACSGKDMIETKLALENDPSCVTAQIGAVVERAKSSRVCGKVSPALNGANNIALMLAAALHQRLIDAKEPGWHDEFVSQVKTMRQYCDLTLVTINRYRSVGNLMLRSNVVACLLPLFVLAAEKGIGELLDDAEKLSRLEEVFKEQLEGRVLEQGPKGEDEGEEIESERLVCGEELLELHHHGIEVTPLVGSVKKLRWCRNCKSMVLWSCDDAGDECWNCAGYSAAPPDELFLCLVGEVREMETVAQPQEFE